MSITAISPAQGYALPGPQSLPQVPANAQGGVQYAFASYEAPSFAASGQPVVGRGAGFPPGAMGGIPSDATTHVQDKVALLKRAEQALHTLVQRMKDDPSVLSGSKPAGWAAFDFVIAETRKSGLYGALQQAAIERLKNSGNYDDLVRQVLQGESNHGHTRDRAWAENWIERQFDFDSVDADLQPGKPYFAATNEWEARPVHNSGGPVKGDAVFLGNKADVHARGCFEIEFTGNGDLMFYTVKDRTTGISSAPRPYDPRGTVIQADGLRAEMFGTPASGDVFSVYKPAEDDRRGSDYRVDYHDSYRGYSVKHWKMDLFDRLFGPVIDPQGARKRPSQIIDDFVVGRHRG